MWPHELKLHRATQHFEELKAAEVRRWEQGEGYALEVKPDGNPPFYIARAELLRPIEEDPFSLLIGDFLQNARAALDYLATALGDIGAGGVMAEDAAAATMFPIVGGDNVLREPVSGPAEFAKRARRRLPTVTEPVRAAIEDLQPYKTGADLWAFEPLWVLNELARFDRHRFLQLGVLRAGAFGLNPRTSRNVRITEMEVETGPFSVLEGIAAEEVGEDRALFGEEGVEYGAKLARFRAEPINPSEEMHMDFEGALEIVFDIDRLPDSVHMISDHPVEWVLGSILRDVREVFLALRPFLPVDPPPW